jgi:adenosylmethionine-8-amino-7-oxononanoate aminotransferase
LLAVAFVADKKNKEPFAPQKAFSARVGQLAAQRGVLVYPIQGSVDGISGDHILVAPPAVITGEQIHWAVGELRAAIVEAGTQVK